MSNPLPLLQYIIDYSGRQQCLLHQYRGRSRSRGRQYNVLENQGCCGGVRACMYVRHRRV